MTCPTCHDTGRAAEQFDAEPYAPIPHYVTITGYCGCATGQDLRAIHQAAADARVILHAAANAYADDHVSPPDYGDEP